MEKKYGFDLIDDRIDFSKDSEEEVKEYMKKLEDIYGDINAIDED